MNSDLAFYVFRYFINLLPAGEAAALHRVLWGYGLHEDMPLYASIASPLKAAGWIKENETPYTLVKDGHATLIQAIAEKVMQAHSDKVVLTTCPKCGGIARAPYATQCRHCGHTWRPLARMMIVGVFEMPDKRSIMVGRIFDGVIKTGNMINFGPAGYPNLYARASLITVYQTPPAPADLVNLDLTGISKDEARLIRRISKGSIVYVENDKEK